MEPANQSRPDPSDVSSPAPFFSRHGAKILALVPLIFLIWVIVQYAVPVPYMDQWELVPLLEKTYHGQLTFHDLWAQQNEHRILFPKVIMLPLARLTDWDIRWELAVNVILALGIFAVFAGQVRITDRKLGLGGLSWAIPAISLVVFSVSQYENWFWGWQLSMFLNLLAVTGGIVLLANGPFRWWKLSAAALLGIVATYSFANGVLIWPIGLLLLVMVSTGTKESRAGIIVWMGIGAFTLGFFFHHYQMPEDHPTLSLIFKKPFEYAAYVFKYLGGICAQGLGGDPARDGVYALAFGLAGTAAAGWAGGTLVWKKIADPKTLLPYFGLSLYSVGSALLTGVGRLDYGSNEATCSRYCTMTVPLWVSLVVFLVLLRMDGWRAMNAAFAQKKRYTSKRHERRVLRRVAGWLFLTASTILVLGLLALGSASATDSGMTMSQAQASGRDCLLHVAAKPASEASYQDLGSLYPRPAVILERYPILVKHRLCVFRHWEPASDPPQTLNLVH